MYEVELKFPVPDTRAIEQRLVALAARVHEPIEQVDRYQIDKATESELVWRLIGVDEPLEQVEPTRWVRFEGWGLAKGLLKLQGVAEPSDGAESR